MREPELARSDTRERYARFDFSREPFNRRQTSNERVEDSPYPEIDEAWIMELEEKVFHPEDHFPPPPADLAPDHPVQKAWAELIEAKTLLEEGVNLIKVTHGFFKRTQKTVGNETLPQEEGMALLQAESPLHIFVKRNMRDHMRVKKEYFQRALGYLYMVQSAPECTSSHETEELFHQVESIFIGHMTYAVVRSATHIYGAHRQNGDLVMDHTYSTCVHVMNRYHRRIQEAKTPEARVLLYEEMKIAIMVAIPHDYMEDFEEMTQEFLEDKMTEHHTFDTTVEAPLRRSGYLLHPRTNPFTRNKRSVLKCLRALTKPPKGSPDREGYLEKQIENGKLTPKEKIICTGVKCGDRLHNLNTLSGKPLAKQVEYLEETIAEITLLAENVMRDYGAKHLNDELYSLNFTVADLAFILLKNHRSELEEMGKVTIVEAMAHVCLHDGAVGNLAKDLFKELFGDDEETDQG